MPLNKGIKKGSIEHGREFPQTAGTLSVLKRRETWMVIADNLSQNHDDILGTAGLPYEGQADGNMSVKSMMAREVEPDALYWEVDVEWDSRIEGGGGGAEDPTSLRPKVRWGSETIELPIAFDQVSGLPIENSVSEPFFITAPHTVPVRYFTRYENHDVRDYYDDLILQFCNKINETPFRGWPPWTVLMASIEAEEEIIRKYAFARVTYITKYLSLSAPSTYIPRRTYESEVLHPVTTIEQIGWRESLLNQGTKYLEDSEDALEDAVPFQDRHGNPTTGNLNIDGTKMPEGNSGNYLRFFRHKLVDINLLLI